MSAFLKASLICSEIPCNAGGNMGMRVQLNDMQITELPVKGSDNSCLQLSCLWSWTLTSQPCQGITFILIADFLRLEGPPSAISCSLSLFLLQNSWAVSDCVLQEPGDGERASGAAWYLCHTLVSYGWDGWWYLQLEMGHCALFGMSPPSKHSAEPEQPFSCTSWPQGSLFALQDAALLSV